MRRVARSRLSSLAQAARLADAALNADERRQAAQALARLAQDAETGAVDGLESWLGPEPSDPVALELRSLRQRFQLKNGPGDSPNVPRPPETRCIADFTFIGLLAGTLRGHAT